MVRACGNPYIRIGRRLFECVCVLVPDCVFAVGLRSH